MCYYITYFPFCPLILLDYLHFQVIKVDFLHKIIFPEPCFGMALELLDIGIQPDGLSQVEAIAGLLQRIKNLMGSGFIAFILNGLRADQMRIIPYLKPDSQV